MSSASLEQLYQAFLATGDERALEQLLRRSSPPLRRHARRIGVRADDIEDLLQETVVAAIEGAERYDPTRPLLPWLKGILTFRAAKLAREEVRRRRLYALQHDGLDAAAAPGATPAADAAGRDLDRDVRAAIASLPPAYRQPLSHFLLGQQSPQEIAHQLGLGRATVRVRLHRGLRRLRQRLLRWSGATIALILLRPLEAATRTRTASAAATALAALALLVVAWRTVHRPNASPTAPPVAPAVAVSAAPEALAGGGPATAADDRRVALAPAPAVANDAAPQLVVQVRDGDGRPLPHVGVVVQPRGGRDPVLYRRFAATDQRGEARFADLAPGPVRVAADRGVAADLDLAPDDPTRNVSLVATGGRAVAGRVVDPAGRPVAGASIWLSLDGGGPWRGCDVATSDASGAFALAGVPATACLAARHHELAGGMPVAVGGCGEVTLQLGPPGGRVALTVVDAAGAPIAAALVFVGEAADAQPLWLAQGAQPWRPPACERRTDAAGTATTLALALGRQPIVVRRPGFAPWSGTVDVAPGATPVHVVLHRSGRITGRVVGDHGLPLPGATVVLRGADPLASSDATTAVDGAFVFECVAPGASDLAARAAGHLATVTHVVAGGDDLDRELRLTPARQLHGRILGVAAAATVRATWPPSALQVDDLRAAVTAGEFAFADAPPGHPRLRIRLDGEPLWRSVDAQATWAGDEVTITLPPDFAATASLGGTLRCADGAPLAAARLFVCRDGVEWAEIGRSDAAGAFRLGPLPPADYDLFAETTSPELPTVPVGRFRLAAGEQRTIEHTADATGSVDLQLARRDGEVLGDVVVTFVGTAIERRFAVASSAEVHQVLLPGDYLVYAMGSRFVWHEAEPVHVRAGEHTTLRLTLEPGSRCTIALAGLPAASGEVRHFDLVDPQGTVRTFTLAPDAPLRLSAVLASGRYLLRHVDAAGRAWRAECEAPDDATLAPLVVQMRPE